MGGRSRTLQLVFLALIAIAQWQTIAAGPVSNEELRGTIQSLIYSYNQLDNKLERHEHRERALGELLKKALQSLQKGQKSLEPINGIFGRLDERVSQIETMLITQEEKYNSQSDRFNQATEHMFKWMRENDECFKRPPVSANLIAPPAAPPAPPAIPKEFLEEQKRLNTKLLEEIQKLTSSVAALKESSQKAAVQTQQNFEELPKGAELLSQIEAKLQEHSASVTTAAPPKNNEFEVKVLGSLNSLGGKVTELSESVQRPVAPVGLTEKDRSFIQELSNDTLNALAQLKSESSATQKSALTETTERLQQTEANIQADVRQLSTEVGILNKFFAAANESNVKLNEGLEALGKFNNIIMTNSEVVLDTQRKVEFGTLNVVQRVGKLLEEEMTKLSGLLQERFATLDGTVVNTQQEANKNISGLLETELNQVWHRIEIMAGEISQSREMLGVMQSASDGYINSTLATMMGLGGRVEETKKHMIDMDENLNFLLGKLSLMSSEFANIKKGLADSLEDLRNSFHVIHERMPTGPGPHNTDKNKYLTDVNLLSKRHAEPERE
ncbi:LOW QUALITY PROTEIN: uncharacterized protein LOC128263486 [Drosophila gunungcola]|uniref:LOW QUALITY PROTEIN: uncharacterized protein LOC128263486 n=1 Tax=Drosophila gunungcola TaxID=103775 RepID=UPI0022E8C3C0|nr:LOW QUALITY PROTEIN: uncharacterized protein LOC128263486 [Drosophila gunungcola]